MSDFNTFTGKTVDDAIGEACRFFSSERERLEIEIISGGSTGIFGLVGKKKAQIKARRRVDPAVAALMREEERQAQAASREARQKRGRNVPRRRQAAEVVRSDSGEAAAAPASEAQPQGGQPPRERERSAATGSANSGANVPRGNASRASPVKGSRRAITAARPVKPGSPASLVTRGPSVPGARPRPSPRVPSPNPGCARRPWTTTCPRARTPLLRPRSSSPWPRRSCSAC